MSSFINSLDMLYIHHNPLDCRCITQMLQQFMIQRSSYASELRYSETTCASPQLVAGRPVHKVQHINDCAVLFGASYGLTQSSELIILLISLIFAIGVIFLIIFSFISCTKRQKFKGTYFTKEQTRTRLTHPMIDTNIPFMSPNPQCPSSTVTSALSEPLSPNSDYHSSHLPPPPPGSMFVTFWIANNRNFHSKIIIGEISFLLCFYLPPSSGNPFLNFLYSFNHQRYSLISCQYFALQ